MIAALARHRVEFVLVGGTACQVYGWTGTTKDVDVTVAIDDANVARVDDRPAGSGGANHPA